MFRNKLLVTLAAVVALTGLVSVSGVQAAATCPTTSCAKTSCTTKTVPVKTIVKNINGKCIKVCISKLNKKCTMKSTKKCAVKPAAAKPANKCAAKPAPAPVVKKPTTKPAPAPAPVKPAPTAAPAKPTPTNTQTSVSAFEKKVADLVNQERAKQGLKPLTLDVKLSDVARAKSQDMKDKNYFSHTSPTYGSPFDMMKKFGITYRAAGENIAKGQRTPEEVMNAWMNSDGHRKNILSPNFTHIGVGYVASGNIWTQMFIGK